MLSFPRAKRSHSSAGSSRNGTPAAVELMLEREAERIILKLVEKALDGDMVALRALCRKAIAAKT
jgi:hypothetical protein